MASTYTTAQGDTFDIAARKALGSELLAMKVAAANPEHVGTVFFPAGVVLQIPEVSTTTKAGTMPPPWRR